MTSHAARRLRRSGARDFPALPTFAGSAQCDGLAFILEESRPEPDLASLRDRIHAASRGRLADAVGSPRILVLVFTAATDARAFPSALPLIARAGILTSLATLSRPEIAAPAGPVHLPRSLELFWNGRRHLLALDALEPVPIAELWGLPEILVHRPSPPDLGAPPRSVHGLPRTAPEKARAGRAPIVHARSPFGKAGADPMGEIDERLLALERRTSLSALARQALGAMKLLFRPEAIGGRPGGGAGPASAGRPAGPGFLQDLAGWIRWHTPLGASLKNAFGQRLGLVEKLIAKGDIDSALKLALRLGGRPGDRKLRTRYPNGLPGMRTRLDFEMDSGFGMPILGNQLYFDLHSRYRELAVDLRRKGDFRRAAWIQSKLLGDHYSAVLTLEAGSLFSEAAALAIRSKQAPPLAIRMLYLAGDRDSAFALARRASCFDALVEGSRERDPEFHQLVVKAWTDDLLATGQPLRALQVTDHLASAIDASKGLLAARKRWVLAAIEAEGRDGFSAETAVRALIAASWTAEDLLVDDAGDFPDMHVSGCPPQFARLLDWLQSAVRGDTTDPRETLLDLLAAFVRLAVPDSPEQAPFWAGPAQPVAEAFARSLLSHASSGLQQSDLEALKVLLRNAELPVLALDVGRVRALHRSPVKASGTWQVPPPQARRPAVRLACLLGNGNLLVWRDSELLQLLDRHGTALWQQSMKDIVALVPLGIGPNAILIKRQWDGAIVLTRFASHDRSFHLVSAVELSAWHDVTSDTQWMVQIGGDIGALDLVKLCAPTPVIEFVWSCALTKNVLVRAFANDGCGTPSWITVDVSRHRYGIIELWTLRNGNDLQANVCVPIGDGERELAPRHYWWLSEGGANRIGVVGTSRGTSMAIWPWTDDGEQRALGFAARRAATGITAFDEIQSCDRGRVSVRSLRIAGDGIERGETRIEDPRGSAPAFVMRHDIDPGLAVIARAAVSPDRGGKAKFTPLGPVLLADEHGRTFLVDFASRRVKSL
ncbi:MAG TPA: hypothetical protein VIT45_06030 [Allosphingosinicella sp.]